MKTRITATVAAFVGVSVATQCMAVVSGVVALDPTAASALSMSGGARIEVPEVYVNSSSARAISASGSGTLAAQNMYVVGGCNFSGGFQCTGTTTRALVPYIDPCASLVAPNPNSLEDRSHVSLSGAAVTLSPGNYPQGIKINGGAKFTFLPGVYSIGGTGLTVTAGSIEGQGVTLVIDKGGVSFSGNSTIRLTPPTTGRTAGAVIMLPTWNTSGVSISGGSGSLITGSIYAPDSTITLVGGSSVTGEATTLGTLVVGRKISLSGQGVIRIASPAAVSTPTPTTNPEPQPDPQPQPEPQPQPQPQALPIVPLPSQPLAD